MEYKSRKIIDKIRREKIQPDPKWKLRIKGYVFWFLLVAMVLLSAGFLSLALLSFVDFDLELLHQLKIGRYVRFLVFSAPYLWIGLFAFCFALGYVVFRKTRKGYRYSALLIAGTILLFVSILGVSAHFAKFNNRIERAVLQGPPGLGKIAPAPNERHFFKPQEGVIAGRITEVSQQVLKLETFEGQLWEIAFDEQTKYRKEELVPGGKVVVVVGEEMGELKFKATGIKVLRGQGRRFLENGSRGGGHWRGEEPPRKFKNRLPDSD